MGIYERVLESKIKGINGTNLASVCVPYFGHLSTISVNF